MDRKQHGYNIYNHVLKFKTITEVLSLFHYRELFSLLGIKQVTTSSQEKLRSENTQNFGRWPNSMMATFPFNRLQSQAYELAPFVITCSKSCTSLIHKTMVSSYHPNLKCEYTSEIHS
ncbi:hypothetical protein AMTRI_Chr09g19660 [Amborella trichopoda]